MRAILVYVIFATCLVTFLFVLRYYLISYLQRRVVDSERSNATVAKLRDILNG